MTGKIGVIGSGQVGQTLADGFLKHGYEVMRGSRDAGKLAEFSRSRGARTLPSSSPRAVLSRFSFEGSADAPLELPTRCPAARIASGGARRMRSSDYWLTMNGGMTTGCPSRVIAPAKSSWALGISFHLKPCSSYST